MMEMIRALAKEKERLRKESLEQSKSNEAQRKLELIEERLKAVEGSDGYGMVDAYKMSLVPNLHSCIINHASIFHVSQ